MVFGTRSTLRIAPLILLLLQTAGATSVQDLSVQQLIDQSELVVVGQISRNWAEWDTTHKYIWTHYELDVSAALKGTPGDTVTLSEPGGVVGLQGMTIAGSVGYRAGDTVLVFLQRMPNGYLRTTGWSQGKFAVDKTGRLHATALPGGLDVVDIKGRTGVSPMRSIDGIRITQLRGLIQAQIHAKGSAQ